MDTRKKKKWRRPYTIAELEKIANSLDDFCCSEFEGDSDAEDILPSSRKTTLASTLANVSSSSLDLVSDGVPSSSTLSANPSMHPATNEVANSNTGNLQLENELHSERTANFDSDQVSSEFDDSDADVTYMPGVSEKRRKLSRFFQKNKKISSSRCSSNSSSEDEDEPIPEELKSAVTAEQPSFSWSKNNQTPLHYSSFNFVENIKQSKMGIDVNRATPLKYFQFFFDKDFCLKILEQSNLYATQENNVLDLDTEELNAFLGVLIFMGFHELPSLKLYWSTDPNFHVDRISETFTLKRFLKILRYIHINDNSKMPSRESDEYDKLYKIRPMVNHLKSKFKNAFIPSRYLSIDESMIGFKGRTSLKQYMPMKPVKRGFKVWAIACAETGYMLDFNIYEGKTAKHENADMLGESVVLTLCENFQDKGYCVTFDNFFSTIALFEKLLEKNIFACGTIRQTRKNYPKQFLCTDKKLKMNESDSVVSENISVYKWKDRGTKCVSLVSNMHNFQEKCEVLRTDQTGSRQSVPCPKSIADYNVHMGGVDLFDQYLSTYSVSWKSRRWWLKIFYYLLDASIVNSYLLYKVDLQNLNDKTKKPMSHLQFRSALVTELISTFSCRKRIGPQNKNKRYFDIGHFPTKGTYRRCAVCSTKKIQKRSNIICKKCNVALCKECFEPYHINL